MQMEFGIQSEDVRPQHFWDSEIVPSFTGNFSISYRRNRKSLNFLLNVKPDRSVAIGVPSTATVPQASVFARTQMRIIELKFWRAHLKESNYVPWKNGDRIFIRGQRVQLEECWIEGKRVVRVGMHLIPIPDDLLDLRRPVEKFLKLQASAFVLRTCQLAAEQKIEVLEVALRRYPCKWGSVWKQGRKVFLDWRLIQMPDYVAKYVIVSHLLQLHSRKGSEFYWKRIELACPSFKKSINWLDQYGTSLR